MKKMMIAVMLLAGCAPAYTKEGCQIFATELMQVQTEACIAGYYAEKARLEGRQVTTCRSIGSTTQCVTE